MSLKLTLVLLKAALVTGAVLLWDDMFVDTVSPYIAYFMPTWVWLLPMERVTQD